MRKFLLIASPFFCCLFFRCLFFRAAPSIVIAASDTSSSIQLSEVKEQAKPDQSQTAKPAKKRVVRKCQTDEQKAPSKLERLLRNWTIRKAERRPSRKFQRKTCSSVSLFQLSVFQ